MADHYHLVEVFGSRATSLSQTSQVPPQKENGLIAELRERTRCPQRGLWQTSRE